MCIWIFLNPLCVFILQINPTPWFHRRVVTKYYKPVLYTLSNPKNLFHLSPSDTYKYRPNIPQEFRSYKLIQHCTPFLNRSPSFYTHPMCNKVDPIVVSRSSNFSSKMYLTNSILNPTKWREKKTFLLFFSLSSEESNVFLYKLPYLI